MSAETEDAETIEREVASYRGRERVLWAQTRLLVANILSACIAAAAHKGLEKIVVLVAPAGAEKVVYVLEAIFFGCFSVVYVHFAFEMMGVYVSWLRPKNLRQKVGL